LQIIFLTIVVLATRYKHLRAIQILTKFLQTNLQKV